jgi:predicted PurR-regulated permease PerM
MTTPNHEPSSASPRPGPPATGSAGAWAGTSRGIARWFALAGFAVLLYLARDILGPFIIAGVLAYVLSPLADQIAARTGLRRGIAAFLVFLVVVALISLLIWLLEARLAAEIRGLRAEGPSIVETAVYRLTGGQTVSILGQELTPRELATRTDESIRTAVTDLVGSPSEALHVARVALEWSLRLILGLIALAYMLIDGHRLGGFLIRFVPPEHRHHVRAVAGEVHQVLGRFLQGQLLLIVIMSTVTYVVLEWGFDLPYALPIAVATGFLEIIPLIGPIAAGAIASLVGFAHGGPSEAALIALSYLVLRQIEDQLLMPYIVGRTVHLHPLITIFSVLTGERVAGVLGALLAVPVAAAIRVILEYAYPPDRPDEAAVPPRERVSRH